jgi:hypothetical protein
MIPFTELSLPAQTAYAQVFEAVVAAEHMRSVADLTGSFAAKTVRGHKYWYFQYTEPAGKLRQIFVGPDSDAVRRLVELKKGTSPKTAVGPLVRSAIALGCSEVPNRHLRVVERLVEYGFFRAGGVLIGIHALLAYGNMLGVRWGDASQTQDVDFAHAGRSVGIALPGDVSVRTDATIQSLEMGFLPISGLFTKSGTSYLNPREPEFRLDFLTPLHRGGTQPYEHPQLGITLQPLKFIEYVLEHVQQSALLSGDRAAVVNVPHAARYALHKLLVYGEREGSFVAKSKKDLAQAHCVLACLRERRPWEVEEAWADLVARGKGWQERARKGLEALDRTFPEFGVAAWLMQTRKKPHDGATARQRARRS